MRAYMRERGSVCVRMVHVCMCVSVCVKERYELEGKSAIDGKENVRRKDTRVRDTSACVRLRICVDARMREKTAERR